MTRFTTSAVPSIQGTSLCLSSVHAYTNGNVAPCRYDMHLSREPVADLVAPHPKALGLVTSWLSHYGVPSSSFLMTRGGNWLKVTSVLGSQAVELLGVSYQLHRPCGDERHHSPHNRLRAPHCAAGSREDRRADNVSRLAAHAVEATRHAPRRHHRNRLRKCQSRL